jgi:hypothetical protein
MTRTLAMVALLAVALGPAGCGARATSLPYAVYADEIPIYPGAVLRDAMGSTSAGDTPESMSDGMAWFFDVQAPADRLLAFYEKRLPQARRDPEWEDGVRLVWVPKGAAAGEELAVLIGENELSIREAVRPGKRPGNPNPDSQDMASDIMGSVGGGSADDD